MQTMKKRDFETYQKRFRDFEILPKFSETHVFRGTIRHPSLTTVPQLMYRTSIYFSQTLTILQMIVTKQIAARLKMLRNFSLKEKRLNTKRLETLCNKTTGHSQGSSTPESTDQARNFEKHGTEFFNKWLKTQTLLLDCKYFPQNEAQKLTTKRLYTVFFTNHLKCPHVLSP